MCVCTGRYDSFNHLVVYPRDINNGPVLSPSISLVPSSFLPRGNVRAWREDSQSLFSLCMGALGSKLVE